MLRAWLLVLTALACLVAPAEANSPSFVRGGNYSGTTSQRDKVQVRVAHNGKTAAVDAGMQARCTGRSHYTFGFIANFHRNPARVHHASMSVNEVDRNLPRDHRIPASKVLRQYFAAHTTGIGHSLAGTYLANATLTDGRRCTTGRVRFTARLP